MTYDEAKVLAMLDGRDFLDSSEEGQCYWCNGSAKIIAVVRATFPRDYIRRACSVHQYRIYYDGCEVTLLHD